IARAFGREGARLALLDIDEAAALKLAAELADAKVEALALKTDVTIGDEVRRAVDAAVRRWQRVDVLVNNAGGFPKIKATEEIDEIVLFLASEPAAYITGATLDINGGLVMQ